MIPPKKPNNFSKILDILNTPAAAKQFSPKTYINLVGEYSKKAYDNGELSQKEYMDIVQPLFGDTGIMATEKIKKYEDELNKYADGGRIGFLEGGTKYNAMVTKMYIEAGGQKGTGMDIDTFAEKYFPKMAQGGRIGFRGGDAAKSDAASGRDAGRSSPSGGADDRSSESQTAAHNAAVAAAQAANKAAEEKMNILDTLSKFRPNTFVNPYDYSVNLNKNIGPFGLNVGINTLGMLGIDDPRTVEDESKQPDYGINAGYNTNVFGGNLNLGAGYNPMSGANLGLSYSKQFNQGGRVNYNQGSMDPDTLALKEKIEEIMDIEGVGFGEAFKQAMRELASQSREKNSEGTMPKSERWMRDYFFSGKGGYDDRMTYKEFALGPGQELYKRFSKD